MALREKLLLLSLTLGLSAGMAHAAQKHEPDDPLPADAKGSVLPVSGEVQNIIGVASGIEHRIDPLAAALKDLGARTTGNEIRIEMAADVLFDFDKAIIKKEAESSLEKVATVVKAHPQSGVTIEGYTDSKGSDAYNQKLSERRAQAVKDWLVKQAALKNMKFSARGFGAKNPVASNTKPDGSDDPEGRQKNRRVEIILRK